MAYTKTFLEISTLITLLVILTQQKTVAADRDLSDLLSSLTDKQHHRKQPLIIVLGRDAPLEMNRAGVDAASSSETSGEAVHMVHHLLEHDQPKKKILQLRMSTVTPYQLHEKAKQLRKQKNFMAQRLREERVLQKENRNVLRSPIVKRLLRISNSLRCEAKDECQDKCNHKFHGAAKEMKCQVQCEIKYACEDEGKDDDEDKDDVCDDSSDSCNKRDEYGSTKGVTWAANGHNPGRYAK